MAQRPQMTHSGNNGGTAQVRLGPDPLLKLRVKEIWRYIWTQPLSYWLICIYLFFEYVRPQSIYEGIAFFPWARVTILLCLGVVLLEKGIPHFRTLASGLLALFTVVVLLSGFTAWRPSLSWDTMDLYLSWVLIYVLIINTVNTEKRYFVFLLSFLIYSLKMSQHGTRTWMGIGFGFQDWGATGGPGWFHNSGEFGIQMCVFLPLAIYFILAVRPYVQKWKLALLTVMPLTAMTAIIGTSSRGAVVGVGLVGLWMVLRSRYRVRAGIGLAVLSVLVFLAIPPEQKERFSEMGEDDTSVHRLTMWEDGIKIANEHPVLGIGYDNWGEYYRAYFTQGLPHNIFIEAVAELGYSGLLVFLSLILATLLLNRRTRRLVKPLGEGGRFLHFSALGLDGALFGFLGSGFFITVLYYPYFWINLAMTVALHLAAQEKAKGLTVAVARSSPKSNRVPRSHRRIPGLSVR
ncbi:MAG: O-antigen ligase family protein [Gemmatimonadota bacterium]